MIAAFHRLACDVRNTVLACGHDNGVRILQLENWNVFFDLLHAAPTFAASVERDGRSICKVLAFSVGKRVPRRGGRGGEHLGGREKEGGERLQHVTGNVGRCRNEE